MDEGEDRRSLRREPHRARRHLLNVAESVESQMVEYRRWNDGDLPMQLARRTRRRVGPGIPVMSMADIAFLLLFFLLVTTTLKRDQGLALQLPAIDEGERDQALELTVCNVWISEDETISLLEDGILWPVSRLISSPLSASGWRRKRTSSSRSRPSPASTTTLSYPFSMC